jgi:hypothetical protein
LKPFRILIDYIAKLLKSYPFLFEFWRSICHLSSSSAFLIEGSSISSSHINVAM